MSLSEARAAGATLPGSGPGRECFLIASVLLLSAALRFLTPEACRAPWTNAWNPQRRRQGAAYLRRGFVRNVTWFLVPAVRLPNFRRDVEVVVLKLFIKMREFLTSILEKKLPVEREGDRENVEKQSSGKKRNVTTVVAQKVVLVEADIGELVYQDEEENDHHNGGYDERVRNHRTTAVELLKATSSRN